MEETKIPEIQISDNKVILQTKEIPLVINGKEELITLQKLAAGTRRDLAKKYLNTKIVGSQVQGSMDALSYQISVLSKVIIKAPFDISENIISSFPENVLDYIYNEYSEWTGDVKKKAD